MLHVVLILQTVTIVEVQDRDRGNSGVELLHTRGCEDESEVDGRRRDGTY